MIALPAYSTFSTILFCPPLPPVTATPAKLLMAPWQVGPVSYQAVAVPVTRAEPVPAAPSNRHLLAQRKLGRHLSSGPTLYLPARTDSAPRKGISWSNPLFDQLTAAARRDLTPAVERLLDKVALFLNGDKANYDALSQAIVDFDQRIRQIGRDECGFKPRQFPAPSADAPRAISRPAPLSPGQIPGVQPLPSAAPLDKSSSNRQRTERFARLLKSICHIEPATLLGPTLQQGDYHYALVGGLASGKDGLLVTRAYPPGKQGEKNIRCSFFEGEAEAYKQWHIRAEEAYTKALIDLQTKCSTDKLDLKDRRRTQRFDDRKALR